MTPAKVTGTSRTRMMRKGTMDVNDKARADGQACIVCGKPGTVAEGEPVGHNESGVEVWCCHGGCLVLVLAALTPVKKESGND